MWCNYVSEMKLTFAAFSSQIPFLHVKHLHQIKGSSMLLRWFDTVINGFDLFSRADRSRFLLMTDIRFISEVISKRMLFVKVTYCLWNILSEKMSLHAERTAMRVAFEANLYKALGFFGKGHSNWNPYDLPISLLTFPAPENTRTIPSTFVTFSTTRITRKQKPFECPVMRRVAHLFC